MARRPRAPWWQRDLGRLAPVCGVLLVAAVAVGWLAPDDGMWPWVRWALLIAAAAAFLVGLVRSPD